MLSTYLALLGTEKEKTAFTELYMKYKSLMYNCAYNILKDKYLAEDAVHNAFISLSKCLGRVNGMSENEKRCYLLIVVRNASYSIYKKNKKYHCEDTEGKTCVSYNDVQINIEATDTADRIFKMIKSLESRYSDVLVLKLFYDMTDSETAKSLGITVENVRVRFFRGKAKLKRLMEKEGLCND